MKEDIVLVSAAVVYKKDGDKRLWFICKKNEEDGWEFPKTHARKGESSVRASIRQMAEDGGMRAKVLEEAGRAGGATSVKDKVLPVRYLYYLMQQKDASGEPVGYPEHEWLEYATVIRKLGSKREKQMLRDARSTLEKLLKKKEEQKRLQKSQK